MSVAAADAIAELRLSIEPHDKIPPQLQHQIRKHAMALLMGIDLGSTSSEGRRVRLEGRRGRWRQSPTDVSSRPATSRVDRLGAGPDLGRRRRRHPRGVQPARRSRPRFEAWRSPAWAWTACRSTTRRMALPVHQLARSAHGPAAPRGGWNILVPRRQFCHRRQSALAHQLGPADPVDGRARTGDPAAGRQVAADRGFCQLHALRSARSPTTAWLRARCCSTSAR